MKTQYGYEFKPKDPIKYDEVLLKQMTCSHILQDKFISRNGNEQTRCKACGLWDSDEQQKAVSYE